MPHDFEIKMMHHNSVTKIPTGPVIVGLAIERGGWGGGGGGGGGGWVDKIICIHI